MSDTRPRPRELRKSAMGEVELEWVRDGRGYWAQRVVAVRYNRRSWRYWRAWSVAALVMAARRVRRP